MAGKLAFLCAQNVNIFAKCHIFHIAAGAPRPPLPSPSPTATPLLPRCPVCPSSVCPRLSTVGNVLFTTTATSDAAGGCGTTCCHSTHSTTCNGNVVVGCRKVGNWQLAAPFGLNKSRPRETSFRSRIDLERVSAL